MERILRLRLHQLGASVMLGTLSDAVLLNQHGVGPALAFILGCVLMFIGILAVLCIKGEEVVSRITVINLYHEAST